MKATNVTMAVREGEEMLEDYVEKAFVATTMGNPIIISISLLVMAFYLIAYLILAIWEKTKLPKPCLHMPSGDALDTYNTYYIVTIATGLKCGAGLDSEGIVKVRLNCTLEDPEPLLISNVKTPGSNPVLQRGGIDKFLLPTKGNLGEILAIDVDLQSINNSPISWYVKYIRVSDVCFGLHSYFVFDRWLKTCDYMRTGVHRSGILPSREFAEKFLEIFLDLNVWTAPWSRFCGSSAFSRSIRLSFSAFVLAFLMLVTILVCLVPAIQNQGLSELPSDPVSIIPSILGMGLAASLIVILLQYTLEIILRRIRVESTGRDLVVRGKNMWKKKPLPMSLYPMYANRLNQSSTLGDGNQILSRKQANLGQEATHRSTSDDVNCQLEVTGFALGKGKHYSEKKSMLKKGQPYRKGYMRLSSVEELETAEENDQEETSFVLNEKGPVPSLTDKTSTVDDFWGFMTYPTPLNNSNGNDIAEMQESEKNFDELLQTVLWDERVGVVSGYIFKGVPTPEDSLKRVSEVNDNFMADLRSLTERIVSDVIEGSLEVFRNGTPSQDVKSLENKLADSLSKLCKEKNNQLFGCLSSGKVGGDSLKTGSSEGHLAIREKVSGEKVPSITSSCPEVSLSVEEVEIKLGPVATKLANSISSTASRNNVNLIQKKSSTQLAKMSAHRMASLTTLAKTVDVPENVLKCCDEAITFEEEAVIQESGSLGKLVDYITSNRVQRLTETSMKHIARASLKTLVSKTGIEKLKDIAASHNEKATQSFVGEVVNNLYQVVRAKMETILAKKYEKSTKSFEEMEALLSAADEEAKMSIIPPLIEYVNSLLVEQAKSLLDVDIDLVMMAFSGQYIDTILTNAVLQTHVGLLKAKVSLEELKEEAMLNNYNVSNNQEFSLDRALIMLERTAELESIMDQLCNNMLQMYKKYRYNDVTSQQDKDAAIKGAFRRCAATYQCFQRILTESENYLKLLAEKLDLSKTHGDDQGLLSQLSDKFLCEGLDLEEHLDVTENLSERLMTLSLDYACLVVAADVVQPFLQSNVDVLNMPDDQIVQMNINYHQCKTESSLTAGNNNLSPHAHNKTPVYSPYTERHQSPNVYKVKQEPNGTPGSPRLICSTHSSRNEITRSESPTRRKSPCQLIKSSPKKSPGHPYVDNRYPYSSPYTERHQSTNVYKVKQEPKGTPGSPRRICSTHSSRNEITWAESPTREKSPGQLIKSSPKKSPGHPYVDDHSPYSPPSYSSNMKVHVHTSPIRSSTPNEKTSVLSDQIDSPAWQGTTPPPSAIPHHVPTGKTSSLYSSPKLRQVKDSPASRLVYDEGEMDSLASVPVCPPSPMHSYDWTHPTLVGATSGGQCIPYLPQEARAFPVVSAGEDHLERVWQLDLEKDIRGETTKCLPPSIMLILHALICISTIASLSICVMLGIRLPNDIAIAWVAVLTFELLVHGLVFETFKVVIVSLYYVYGYDETM